MLCYYFFIYYTPGRYMTQQRNLSVSSQRQNRMTTEVESLVHRQTNSGLCNAKPKTIHGLKHPQANKGETKCHTSNSKHWVLGIHIRHLQHPSQTPYNIILTRRDFYSPQVIVQHLASMQPVWSCRHGMVQHGVSAKFSHFSGQGGLQGAIPSVTGPGVHPLRMKVLRLAGT